MNFLDQILNQEENQIITGLTDELKCIYTYKKQKKENQTIIFLTSNLHQAGKYYTTLSSHTNNVWFFPMDDFLTSEAIAISPEFKTNRLETINHLLQNEKGIIITTLMGYLRFLPPKNNFKESYITLKTNETYNRDKLIEKLYKIGYIRQSTVNMTGEIAPRGFVLDIFPTNTETPIRIEFWSDTIESIKTFDINTQRTIKQIDNITIHPNTEYLIDKDPFDHPYRDMYKYTKVQSILDYANKPIVIYDDKDQIIQNYKLLQEEIIDYNKSTSRKENTKYMHNLEDIKTTKEIIFKPFPHPSEKATNYQTKEILPLPKTIKEKNKTLNNYLKNKKQVIICLNNRYQINHTIENLQNPYTIYTNENKIFKGKINIIKKQLEQGFETPQYIVITPKELYNIKQTTKYKTNFKIGTKIKDISNLEQGDYVVHNIHGIGKYLGIKTITKNGLKKDYLTLEYKDKDKLYIPVEKIEYIKKYSSKDSIPPKINKLGTKEWQKTKAKANKKAEDIANELIKLYAIRETKEGFAFPKDTEEQIIFEKEFEYEETLDQLKVTEDIKKDMESPHPMDRLLCADVGYGKTEVAFRAIFKCIMGGKQAAMLCPTTILSSQHLKNAIKRFSSFPINIELLNRFVPQKKQTEIKTKLQEGKIDLLIGTHRILSDDIKFKDLGLLVIDEEQRFGVKHKEKIKQYKNNIDILTLSATPIPRTLQLSMSGIRSLSLIETPPAQRYPIQTYVLQENDQIIKDAISKELARNGQTFILYNNIENIEQQKARINSLIKEAKVEIAHGKMDKNQLEKVMNDFNNQEFDVLLCTTIIETGIDIPTVNTLIIIDADRFGLSQLYQIRGRIGRSNKIAYCYLMYNNQKILSEIATKRLKVIKDFTELGSGFAIATRDLSIRGAGNILGQEQAGFITTVGVEMFLEMVNEAVNKLKGKPQEEKQEKPNPLVEVETYIPDQYVKEEDLKIEIHKKINQIDSSKKLNQVKEELEDRFGKVSEDLIIYMHEELFEKQAQKQNIKDIKQTKNFITITLDENQTNKIDGENLFYKITQLSRMIRLSMRNNKLIITLDTIKLDKHFIYYLLDILKIIKQCEK